MATTSKAAAKAAAGPGATTASGYARRDVARAMTDAIAAGDAERACCLAAELCACAPEDRRTGGERAACADVASRLVDVYAQSYASVDAGALRRVADAMRALFGEPKETGADANSDTGRRRAVCTAVVALTLGLPRQDVSEHILASAYGALGAAGTRPTTKSLVELIRAGRASEAVLKAHRDSLKTAESCATLWDACAFASASDSNSDYFCPSWRDGFVADARFLFHLGGRASSTKAVRQRRANLALCAVLVAASPSSTPAPPSTWAASRADRATEVGLRQIDAVFADIYGDSIESASGHASRHEEEEEEDVPWDEDGKKEHDKTAPADRRGRNQDDHHEDEDDGESSHQDDEDDIRASDGRRRRQPPLEMPRDYLQMYTTIDYAARGLADDARHASRAATLDLAPVKTVVLR